MPLVTALPESDFARWLSAARTLAQTTIATNPGRRSRAAAWVADIAAAAAKEVGALTDALTAGNLSPDRWQAATLDSLAIHALGAVYVWLDLDPSDDSIDALPDDDRDAAARLILKQANVLLRIKERIQAGSLLLTDPDLRSTVVGLAEVTSDIAEYVGLGKPARVKPRDVDDAAALWDRLAPSWASGLMDAGSTEGDDGENG